MAYVPVSGVILAGDLNIFRTSKVDGRIMSYVLNHVVNSNIARIAQGKSVVHIQANEISKIMVTTDTKQYEEYPETRDLDGLYIQVLRKGNRVFRCFTDLSIKEQTDFLKGLDNEALVRTCLLMTHTLRDIADSLNLYGDRAIEDDQVIISYKKLWKLLIDKDLKRREFAEKAGISDYTLVQMNKGKKIQPVIIERICSTLGCTPNEIMEFETIE